MGRAYNFSAGPAQLPEAVLLRVRDELLDWHGVGASIMELSHRGKHFSSVAQKSEQDLRELLAIPDHYRVLFLQGGGRLQFAMIPMNLLGKQKKAAYIDSGIWSQLAIAEARKYADVHIVASGKAFNYQSMPDSATWDIPDDAAYLYYVSNETINGLEFPDIPQTHLPLVADMSSSLLTQPIDVSRFGLIFATAQKNIGPAGLTVVIVREDLLARDVWPATPSFLEYAIHVAESSLYNTGPTFAWYVAGLVFEWLKSQGGLSVMAEHNQRKAKKLYQFIDHCPFYNNSVDPRYRSRMNVIFNLSDAKKNDLFLEESENSGLLCLKGHKQLGGMRASIYNAMPESGVEALIQFMENFASMHSL